MNTIFKGDAGQSLVLLLCILKIVPHPHQMMKYIYIPRFLADCDEIEQSSLSTYSTITHTYTMGSDSPNLLRLTDIVGSVIIYNLTCLNCTLHLHWYDYVGAFISCLGWMLVLLAGMSVRLSFCPSVTHVWCWWCSKIYWTSLLCVFFHGEIILSR